MFFLRSLLFNIFFWPAFLGFLLIMMPFAYFFTKRQADEIVYVNLGRLLNFCLKLFVKIDCQVVGIENLDAARALTPVIIGCSHQSTWETIVFPMIAKNISIVAKKELLSIPVVGFYIKKFGCLTIDRSSPILSIKSLLQNGKNAIKKNSSILIFPNGTREKISEHSAYKVGLFALYKNLQIPVVPCSLNSGMFWPKRSFIKNPGTIVLEFQKPINPGLNKEEFMQTFENVMSEMGNSQKSVSENSVRNLKNSICKKFCQKCCEQKCYEKVTFSAAVAKNKMK